MSARAAAATVFLLVAAVFLPAVACGFVNWDDGHYVYGNAAVQQGLSVRTFVDAWTTVTFCNWAPLTTLSYLLDATIYGVRPWGFHLTNVVLHAATCGLLYMALVGLTGAHGRSFVATLLFALHPLRVESVVWVAERKDVLSVFFLPLALLAYERYCRRPSWQGYAAVAAAMTASLLAKATLVTLPVLLLLLDFWPLRRCASVPWVAGGPATDGRTDAVAPRGPQWPWTRLVAEKVPLLVISLVFIAITLATQEEATQEEWRVPLLPVRLPLGLWSVVRYLGMTLWPVGLHPSYCHPGPDGVTPAVLIGSVAGVMAVVGCAAAAWRACPAVTVGLAWYMVALTPVLGIVKQQGFQSHADRFTYVPHIGLAVAVVWLCADLAVRRGIRTRMLAVITATVLAGFIVADERQIGRWRDTETLWQWVLAVEPTNDHGGQYLAAHYARAGEWERAQALAAEIAARYPRTQAFADIAQIREEGGDVAGAATICHREVEVKRQAHGADHPETLEAVSRLVTALRNAGDPEAFALARAAEGPLRQVLGLTHMATLRTLLVVATGANRAGDPAAAERQAREVLAAIATTRENPSLIRKPATIVLAESLDRQGRPAEAVALLEETIAALGGSAGGKAVENSQLVVTLAAVLANQGNLSAAERVLAPVADALERTLGPQHPATRPATALLGRIRRGPEAGSQDAGGAPR